MDSRERVKMALSFQEPDRIPLDIGGAFSCGISVKAYKRLLDYLGIEVEEINISKVIGQLAAVDEVVLKKIGVDVRAVGLDKPSNWKLDIKENQDYYWFYDEWQRKYQMPKSGGHYYDIVEFPLAKEDFENYQWPDPMDPNRFSGLVEKAQAFQEKTGAALVAPEYLANGFLQMGAQLQGFSKWLMMLAAEPSRVEKFLDQLLEFKMKFWDAYLSKVGDKIDVACEADDLGTQRGTWISKDMYRKYIKPRQSKLYSFIKKKADVKVFLHSYGSVYDFIPDLIEQVSIAILPKPLKMMY